MAGLGEYEDKVLRSIDKYRKEKQHDLADEQVWLSMFNAAVNIYTCGDDAAAFADEGLKDFKERFRCHNEPR